MFHYTMYLDSLIWAAVKLLIRSKECPHPVIEACDLFSHWVFTCTCVPYLCSIWQKIHNHMNFISWSRNIRPCSYEKIAMNILSELLANFTVKEGGFYQRIDVEWEIYGIGDLPWLILSKHVYIWAVLAPFEFIYTDNICGSENN